MCKKFLQSAISATTGAKEGLGAAEEEAEVLEEIIIFDEVARPAEEDDAIVEDHVVVVEEEKVVPAKSPARVARVRSCYCYVFHPTLCSINASRNADENRKRLPESREKL